MKTAHVQSIPHATAAEVPMQPASWDIWDKKYRLKTKSGESVDDSIDGTCQRVAKALADVESTPELRQHWYEKFLWALRHGAIPAGRIISNAGAWEHKPATSTINCTVSGTIHDSMDDILGKVHEAGLTLKAGCGIGYEFSTLRPRGAYVSGAGAYTSGPLSFMDIYDKMCFTVSSAGGRRGAQMGTFDIGHPDALEFIRAKREAGRLRQFNLSLLITHAFMEAVKNDTDWVLAFPLLSKEAEQDGINLTDPAQIVWREWPVHDGLIVNAAGEVACKVYRTMRARRLWDMIMASTYDYAEPGFILIDRVNEMNNNWFCENIRTTNPSLGAGTLVHTRHGIVPIETLADRTFEVRALDGTWGAARCWLSNPAAETFTITLANGQTIVATPQHRWPIWDPSTSDFVRTPSSALKPGDLLPKTRVMPLEITIDATLTRDEGFALGRAWSGNTAFPARFADIPTDRLFTEVIYRSNELFVEGLIDGLFCVNTVIIAEKQITLRQASESIARGISELLSFMGITGTVQHDVASNQWYFVLSPWTLQDFLQLFSLSCTETHAALQDFLRRATETSNHLIAIVSITPNVEKQPVWDINVDHPQHLFPIAGCYTGNCGEQALPPYGSCLLGSVNLTLFVQDPFTDQARFDFETYREVVAIFTRMLDNVVEINGLPLEGQRAEITAKRRHGMGYLGLGSTLTLLGLPYGSPESLAFTESVTREMALIGWKVALELAREKGVAPILEQAFTVTAEMLHKRPEMITDGYHVGDAITGKVLHARYSRYMQRISTVDPQLVDALATVGARFTHHTSIAPTGTIALSLANNASNGIEPSFAHHYFRNIIRPGKKSKEKVEVFSFELLAYRHLINPKAVPSTANTAEMATHLPKIFTTADEVTPKQHVDIQAAAQHWIDSSISKTANVPTDFPYEDFKNIYLYAYEQGLKGCTTFRFNPAAFQGVLVKEQDLSNTLYRFVLEDGSEVDVDGNEEIEYDGEIHTAANLFDAIKEGYYGKL